MEETPCAGMHGCCLLLPAQGPGSDGAETPPTPPHYEQAGDVLSTKPKPQGTCSTRGVPDLGRGGHRREILKHKQAVAWLILSRAFALMHRYLGVHCYKQTLLICFVWASGKEGA